MFFRFRHQGAARPIAARRRLARFRPCIEGLEDRTLLSMDFNSALNLDTYPWVRQPDGSLFPQGPLGPFNYNQARHPDAVAIGDFNGDGVPDIAVADYNTDLTSIDEGEISVFLGDSNGDGSFAHTQPVVDLTTSPPTQELLDSGGLAPVALVAARLRGPSAPLDLIVVNQGIAGLGANVSVLLGNGDGTFQLPVPYGADIFGGLGLVPTALAVGDFNGDGNLDVVVADKTLFPGYATILYGDGHGGFSSSQQLALSDLSGYPVAVATGSFGNPSHDFFVTANTASDNVTVVQTNPDGSFLVNIYPTDVAPVAVAVADMNGDGYPDIITANNGGDDVSILFGNPDPNNSNILDFGKPDPIHPNTFDVGVPVIFPAGPTPTSLAVGNFDGLGPEVAVTNGQSSVTSANTVSVLTFNPNHNQPDNSDLLMPPVGFQAGEDPVAVAAAQLRKPSTNMPGFLDLVVANYGNILDRGSVNVFLNEGRTLALRRNFQLFPSPASIPTGLQPDSVAVGDFNGDGLPDFVTANASTNDLSVLLNNGSNPGVSFQPLTDPSTGLAYTLGTVGVDPVKVVVGDFNNDGHPDIAVADFGDFGVVPGSITVFLNTGMSNQPFENDPSHYFYYVFPNPNIYFVDMATGHFDSSGNLDLAVLFLNASTGGYGIAILFGDGSGNFTRETDLLLPSYINYLSTSTATALAVGDFYGDGKDSIAVTVNQPTDVAGVDPPTLLVLRGDGNGMFEAPVGYDAGTHLSAIAVGDLRNDNRVDIVVANENFPGGVTVFLNNGDGTFQSGVSYFAGTNPRALVIADINGDGNADIAVANINGDSVSLLLGKGDGTFQNTVAYVTGGLPFAIAAGDFFDHRDGRLDLITANSASNTASVLENTEPPPSSGQGGGAALRLEPASPSPEPTPADLDNWFLVFGGSSQEPLTLAAQPAVMTKYDAWYPVARRHRPDDGETLWTLGWEEN
jgi:hypothetical protein